MSPESGGFVRSFVALEIDSAVRERLSAALAVFVRAGADVRWTPATNIHLSLAFLGAIPSGRIPDLGVLLDKLALGRDALELRSSGIGFFGRPDRPRVIWAGVEATPELMSLQDDLRKRLETMGLPTEERGYRPHLTLGRVRSVRNFERLGKALAREEKTDFGTARVGRMCLMRSTLEPAGAVYSVLHASGFAGRADNV